MSDRITIRLPEWMADAIKQIADNDPYADGKMGRTIRALLRDKLRENGIVPRETKRQTKDDNLD